MDEKCFIILLPWLLRMELTACALHEQKHEGEPQCYSRFDYEYKTVRQLVALEDAFSELKTKNEELLKRTELLENEINRHKGGRTKNSIYVRWGRTECPGDGSEMVYRGFTAGRHYTSGGGTSILCLPEKPTWNAYNDGHDSYRGNIWGAEIDMDPASEGKVFEQNVDGLDMPCSACLTPKSVTHMFPGRATCFPGWSLEYTGYLMTNYRDRGHNMEYFCLDIDPEGIPRGGASDHENVMYLVEARCGTLPCPPYVEGREVACCVCSK